MAAGGTFHLDQLLTRARNLAARPLLRNIFKVALGNVGGNALNLAAVLLLGRVLQEQYGVLGTLQTVMLLIAQLADVGLNLTLVKFYREECDARKNPVGAEALLRALFWLRLIIVGALAGLGMLTAGPLAAHIDMAGHVGLLRLACLGAVANSLWMFAQAAMQAREQFNQYALQTFANHALRLGLVLMLFGLGQLTVRNGFVVIIVVPLLGAAFCLLRQPPLFWSARMSDAELRQHCARVFHFSKWVLASFVIVTLITHATTLQLAGLASATVVGFYRIPENLAQGLALVTSAIGTVMLPKISLTRTRAQLREVLLACSKALVIIAPLLCLGWLLSIPLLPLVLGPAFAVSSKILGVLLLVQFLALWINPVSMFCYAFGKSHWLVLMNLLQLAIILIANQFLIPRLGVMGPAWGTLLMHILGLIFVGLATRRLYREYAEPA